MANVDILTDQPSAPPAEQTAALTPVRAGALRRMAQGAAHCATWRVHRAARVVFDYDTSASPIDEQTPAGISRTVRGYWTASPRAQYVWLHIRLQAAEDKGSSARPELTASLTKADDTEVDPGIVFDVQLEQLDVEADDTWAPFSVFTPLRITDTPVSASAPRMLNIDGEQGELLAVKLACTGVRTLSMDIWEFVPSVVPQTFSP